MSFSDPVHIIDHIPRDFDMKRITRKRPLQQRKLAKAQSAKAAEPSSFEPPCEQVSAIFGRQSPSSVRSPSFSQH